MSALTPFGIVHTVVSVSALASGIVALVKRKEIDPHTRLGAYYVGATLVTALTGIVIFHHGGFGPPHMLSILTVLALGIGIAASRDVFGARSHALQLGSLSATVFFHLIPAFNETTSRLPVAAPLTTGPDDPLVKAASFFFLVLFVVGLRFQLRYFRRESVSAVLARQ